MKSENFNFFSFGNMSAAVAFPGVIVNHKGITFSHKDLTYYLCPGGGITSPSPS